MKKLHLPSFFCILTVLTLGSTSLRADLGDGMIGYWDLDGNTLDTSGTGAHGTYSATTAPTFDTTTAKFGQSILFDGTAFVTIDTVPVGFSSAAENKISRRRETCTPPPHSV